MFGARDQIVNFTLMVLGRYGGTSVTIAGSKKDAALLEAQQATLNPTVRFAPGKDDASWKLTDGKSDIAFTGLITGSAAVAVAAKTGLLVKLGSYLLTIILALKKAFIAILAGFAAVGRWIIAKMSGKPVYIAASDPKAPPNA